MQIHSLESTASSRQALPPRLQRHVYQQKLLGVHPSAAGNPEELMKTLVNDSRRANTILFDHRVAPFISNFYLTPPQAVTDVGNPYKKSRSIFDASFLINCLSYCISSWTDKNNEPDAVTFPGSFDRLLEWIWNMRILFPLLAILLFDNDF